MASRFSDVEDSIAVGRRIRRSSRKPKDEEEVLLFVKMKGSAHLDSSLRSEIAREIQSALSSRHVPKGIYEVKDIPYTLNGNKVERAVRNVIAGEEVKMKEYIIDPECLSECIQLGHPLGARL